MKPSSEPKVERSLQVLNKNAVGIQKWLAVTTLEDEEMKDACAAARAQANGLFKDAEEDRKSFTGPLNAVVKSINERYKPITDQATSVINRCSALLLDWQNAQRKIAAAKAEKEAKKAEKQGAVELANDIREQALTVKVDLGPGVNTRRAYSARITDPKKIELETWLLVEEELIKKMSAVARAEKEAFKVPGFALVVSEVVQGGSRE